MHSTETTRWHAAAVERAIALMRCQLPEQLDLGRLCQTACLSKFHFVRVFQEVTGVTPRRYLTCLRIERAKELLAKTARDITEICLDVGYSSLGTFSRTFSCLVGISPSEYRASIERYDLAALVRLARRLETDVPDESHCLRGHLVSPEESRGIYLVGAFRRGVPHGEPASGTALLSPGPFVMRAPADRVFHLLALMLPLSELRSAVSGAIAVRFVAGLRVAQSTASDRNLPPIILRPVRPTDPPVLLSLAAIV